MLLTDSCECYFDGMLYPEGEGTVRLWHDKVNFIDITHVLYDDITVRNGFIEIETSLSDKVFHIPASHILYWEIVY